MAKEYIEREAAFDTITDLAGRATSKAVYAAIWKSAKALKTIPAADVVEVVRCKECKHRGHGEECPMFHLVWLEADRYGWNDVTMDEYYCSYGERKDGAEL